MERKYTLTIPEPCTENWDKMIPKENGRFCLSCSKTVVDFTAMLPHEVQHFFNQNQNNKVCGRFKKSQLDTITIQIPNRILYIQNQYRKMFLLALFIAMGTTLFSCQDKNGNKQKIDKVEVVDNDTLVQHITVGETASKNIKSDGAFLPPPPPPPKVDHIKFVKPVLTNCSKTSKDKKSSNQSKEDDSQFVTGAVMQKNAEFPGGIDPFYTFFTNEFKAREYTDSKNLNIRISFAVEKNGSLSYIESVPAIDKTVEQEIIRVLSLSPKWEPGESNGKKIRMQYSLPIVLE